MEKIEGTNNFHFGPGEYMDWVEEIGLTGYEVRPSGNSRNPYEIVDTSQGSVVARCYLESKSDEGIVSPVEESGRIVIGKDNILEAILRDFSKAS